MDIIDGLLLTSVGALLLVNVTFAWHFYRQLNKMGVKLDEISAQLGSL